MYDPDPNSDLENGQFDTARFERMKAYVAKMKKKKLTEIPLDFAMTPNPEPRKTKFVKDLGDMVSASGLSTGEPNTKVSHSKGHGKMMEKNLKKDKLIENRLSDFNKSFETEKYKPITKKETNNPKQNSLVVVDSENIDEFPEIRKYWAQRYRYFTKFEKGIKLDYDMWFSVTPEPIAKHVAEQVCASYYQDEIHILVSSNCLEIQRMRTKKTNCTTFSS